MTKYFCDGCGKEITKESACAGAAMNSPDRLGTEVKKRNKTLKVEVMTGTDGTWNDGEWCKYCVLDALYKLDDRPKALMVRK